MSEPWREMTLGAVVKETGGSIKTGPFGTALKAAEYTEHGAPVISTGEVGYGRLRLHDRTPRLGGSALERLHDYVLEKGDIVFSRKGAIDRSAWVGESEAGFFLGSDALRVRFDTSRHDSRFIAYGVLNPVARAWVRQHASGTTMPSLNQEILSRIPLLIPPLQEQRRIAGVLGTFDDLIDTNERLVSSLREQVTTLFQRMMRTEPLESRPFFSVYEVDFGAPFSGDHFTTSGNGMPLLRIRDLKTIRRPGDATPGHGEPDRDRADRPQPVG